MNKKAKNRKELNHNQRNKSINRHYRSAAKNLIKLLKSRFNSYSLKNSEGVQPSFEKEMLFLESTAYSAIDKAVKKGVFHQNSGSKKKSRVAQLVNAFLRKNVL